MELQLGLSLSNGFDLNARFHEPSKEKNVEDLYDKKRRCDVAFDQSFAGEVPRTLPLLVWNSPPNDDGDDDRDSDDSLSSDIIKTDGENDCLIGWPPIKYQKNKRRSPNNRPVGNDSYGGNAAGAGGMNSMYVKVNMEGMGITRKVDLSLHDSHQTLVQTLLLMFGKGEDEHSNGYELAYQDREGDWLLAQDIPWRTFIGTVHRLKLLKRND